MNSTINPPIILTTSIINLFNNLIKNKGINIKKLYSLDNYILENNILEIKNIYCKNRTIKGTICLNKCIENSKYCKIHDPIKRKYKKINNIKKRFFNKEIKIFRNIEYLQPDENVYKKIKGIITIAIDRFIGIEKRIPDLLDLNTYTNIESSENEFIEKSNKQLYIKNNKEHKLTQENINEILDYVNSIHIEKPQDFKNKIFIKYSKDELSKESYLSIYNTNLLNNLFTIDGFLDNSNNINILFKNLFAVKINKEIQKVEPIYDIKDYKNQLLNINKSIYEPYQGLELRKLCKSIIELQFKLYNIQKGNTNINSKSIKFIHNIVKHIPNK